MGSNWTAPEGVGGVYVVLYTSLFYLESNNVRRSFLVPYTVVCDLWLVVIVIKSDLL